MKIADSGHQQTFHVSGSFYEKLEITEDLTNLREVFLSILPVVRYSNHQLWFVTEKSDLKIEIHLKQNTFQTMLRHNRQISSLLHA